MRGRDCRVSAGRDSRVSSQTGTLKVRGSKKFGAAARILDEDGELRISVPSCDSLLHNSTLHIDTLFNGDPLCQGSPERPSGCCVCEQSTAQTQHCLACL